MTETATGGNERYTACIARRPWNTAEVYACVFAGGKACPEDPDCLAYENYRLKRSLGPVSPAAAGQQVETGQHSI